MDEIEERAFRAYFRRFGKTAPIPSQQTEYVDYEGKSYIVLSNVSGILAVYRIRTESLRYINPNWFESHIYQKWLEV